MARKKKACKSCASARRKRRIPRRRGLAGVGKANLPVQQVAFMGAGAIAGMMADPLLSKIPVKVIQDNPLVRNGIKAALGIFLATQKNEMIANAGLGMAALGLANMVSGFLPGAGAGTTPVQGIFGTISQNGRYQLGSGPVQMAGFSSYETIDGLEFDGIGTDSPGIYGGIEVG